MTESSPADINWFLGDTNAKDVTRLLKIKS